MFTNHDLNMADESPLKKVVFIPKCTTLFIWILLAVIYHVHGQEILLRISDTRVTLKEGATLRLLCGAFAADLETDVSGGTFTWKHIPYNGDRVSSHGIDTTVDPRVSVTQSVTVGLQSSSLVISDTTADDSGIISCQYQHRQDPGMPPTETLSVNTFVCVAKIPVAPRCSVVEGEVVCLADGICSDDATLRWSDGDSRQELYGGVTQTTRTTILKRLETEADIGNYLCQMESVFYPDVLLNCSLSEPKTDASISTTTTSKASDFFDPVTSRMVSSSDVTTRSQTPYLTSLWTQPQEHHNNTVCTQSCDWAISTTTTLALISVISIIINIIFGIECHRRLKGSRQLHQSSSNRNHDIPGIQQTGAESTSIRCISLEIGDFENLTYSTLNTGNGRNGAAIMAAVSGANSNSEYEVKIPNLRGTRSLNEFQC